MNRYAQISETLIDHPKMTRAMRKLMVHRLQLVGHLACLWNWAMKHAPDGDLSRVSRRDIADAARWTDRDDFGNEADEAAGVFVAALIECRTSEGGVGFLEPTEDGRLLIHDWQEFGGRLDTKRKERDAFLTWIRRQGAKLGVPVAKSEENLERWREKLPPVEADAVAGVAEMSSRHRHDNSPTDGRQTADTAPMSPRQEADVGPTRERQPPDTLTTPSRHDGDTTTCREDVATTVVRHDDDSPATSPPNRAEQSKAEHIETHPIRDDDDRATDVPATGDGGRSTDADASASPEPAPEGSVVASATVASVAGDSDRNVPGGRNVRSSSRAGGGADRYERMIRFVEKTLHEHPEWVEELSRETELADPADPLAYQARILRNWLNGDGTPKPRQNGANGDGREARSDGRRTSGVAGAAPAGGGNDRDGPTTRPRSKWPSASEIIDDDLAEQRRNWDERERAAGHVPVARTNEPFVNPGDRSTASPGPGDAGSTRAPGAPGG